MSDFESPHFRAETVDDVIVVSLLVSERPDGTTGIVEGTYQSPILVQWRRAPQQRRVLDVSLTEIR